MCWVCIRSDLKPLFETDMSDSSYSETVANLGTLPVKMVGPFWSVWYEIALAEVGMSLP